MTHKEKMINCLGKMVELKDKYNPKLIRELAEIRLKDPLMTYPFGGHLLDDEIKRLVTIELEYLKTQVHPEDFCQKCEMPNPVWSAPNEIWNEVIPDRAGIFCPKCFQDMATEKGINILITAKLIE